MEEEKRIKISEGIRIAIEDGIQQHFGSLVKLDEEDNLLGCCAIGAAEHGYAKVNEKRPYWYYSTIKRHFPDLARWRDVPICDRTGEVRDIIIGLNDRQRRSLEEIADCLEAAGL